MTIIPRNALSTRELNQLGNNFDDVPRRDQGDIDAMNRSLATLGDEFQEQIETATRSEQVAS